MRDPLADTDTPEEEDDEFEEEDPQAITLADALLTVPASLVNLELPEETASTITYEVFPPVSAENFICVKGKGCQYYHEMTIRLESTNLVNDPEGAGTRFPDRAIKRWCYAHPMGLVLNELYIFDCNKYCERK
jgi:hypothetical protein